MARYAPADQLQSLHNDYISKSFDILHWIETSRSVSEKKLQRNIRILSQSHDRYIDKCFDLINDIESTTYYKNIFSRIDNRSIEKIFPNMLLLQENNVVLHTKKEEQIPTDAETPTLDIWDIVNESKTETNTDAKSDNFDDIVTPNSEELTSPRHSTRNVGVSILSLGTHSAFSGSCLSDSRLNTTATPAPAPPISPNPNQNICSECGAIDSMIEEITNSRVVCSKCGYEKEELLENGPEWHQYNNDDSRGEGVNRCGSYTSYYFPKSSQGTVITGICSSRINRKQKWNSNVYKENSLNKEFDAISTLCSKNKISKANENTAKYFYKKISDCKHKSGKNIGKQIIIRGINRDSVIGACIYKACETNHDPITKKEIAKIIGQTEKRLSSGIKQFEKIMRNCDDDQIIENIHDGTPEDYIKKFCPKLCMTPKQIELGITISDNCAKLKLATDHGAQSIGAGVTLLVIEYLKLNIDRKHIAKLFKTSDVTIVKIYHKIAPYTRALVDDDITDHIIKKFKVNG